MRCGTIRAAWQSLLASRAGAAEPWSSLYTFYDLFVAVFLLCIAVFCYVFLVFPWFSLICVFSLFFCYFPDLSLFFVVFSQFFLCVAMFLLRFAMFWYAFAHPSEPLFRALLARPTGRLQSASWQMRSAQELQILWVL